MSGVAGRSGGHNAKFVPGAEALPALDPGKWPWDKTPLRVYDMNAVRGHVVAYCVKHDLCVSPLERDFLGSIVSCHYLRARALRAIACAEESDDDPMVGRTDAFTVLRSAENNLRSAWSSLGVRSPLKKHPEPETKEEFLDQFAIPTDDDPVVPFERSKSKRRSRSASR